MSGAAAAGESQRRREVPFGFYMLDVSLPAFRKKRPAPRDAKFAQRAARAAEARAVFRRFDRDDDGILNRDEMEAAAGAVCPAEAWDPALWEEFCIEFEADPTYGFGHEAFERFHTAAAAAHPTSAVSIADLPQLDWPDDWPATEVRLATTIFMEYDADGDTHLSLHEMRSLVENEHPAETWADDEWEAMCEHLGVSPDSGLSFEAFLRFRLSVAEAEAEQVWEDTMVGTENESVEFMSEGQLRHWAVGAVGLQANEHEGVERWDEALWPQLCESFGADPSRGFTREQFVLLFRTRQVAVEAQEQLGLAKATADRLQAKDARDVFLRYDVDCDGFLNLDEMGVAALQVFLCLTAHLTLSCSESMVLLSHLEC